MRSALLAFLLVAVLAPVAVAVPVNVDGVGGVAAILPLTLDPGSFNSGFYVLTVGGEVWWANPGNPDTWRRAAPGYTGSAVDPPVPVADIAEWWLWGCLTREGVYWSFLLHGWIQLPAPPFTPIAAQQKSLGSAKQGYR